MKLNKKYFEDVIYLINETHLCFDPIPGRKRMLKILRQIAKDAFEAGAEAQKEKCLEKLEIVEMHTWYGDSGYTIAANMRVAIINSATVKWEEK